MSDIIPLTMPKIMQDPKKRVRIIVAVALLLILAVLCLFFWSRKTISSEAALVDGMVYTVSPHVTGKVAEISVIEGDRVTKGQVVARMDVQSTESDAKQFVTPSPQTERLGGSSQSVEAVSFLNFPTVEEVRKRLQGAQEAESRAVARLAKVRREEEVKQRQMEEAVLLHVQRELHMRSLAETGGVHSPEYLAARTEEEHAKRRMQRSQEAFEASSRVRAAVENEVNRVRYEVQEAKRIATRYRYQPKPANTAPTTGESPIRPVQTSSRVRSASGVSPDVVSRVEGIVMKISASPGDTLRTGDPLFLVIPEGNEKSIWVKAWFPSTAKDDIKTGLTCSLEREIDKRRYDGTIEEVMGYEPLPKSQGQEGVDFLAARVAVSNPEGLFPGDAMRCTVTLSIF